MDLFVANNLGVLAFNGTDWTRHDFKSGKKKRSLAFDDQTNRLYVGSQGEFGYYQEGWGYVPLEEMIPDGQRDFDEVWDVFLAQSKVYFCTFQRIFVYDGQSISVIEHPEGLQRSFQNSGKLFTQTEKGRLFEINNGKLVSGLPQGQNNQIIAGMIPKDEGYLLFYNSGNIEYSTSFGVSSPYPELVRALKGRYVNHVLQLSDNRLVISTQTSGLFLFDMQTESLENIKRQDGLPSNACLRSFQDYNGSLWVGMQNGIALVDINAPMRLLNRQINLEGSGYEAFASAEGTYYTTSNGIYFLAAKTKSCVFLPGTEGPAYGMQMITGRLYASHHTGLFLLENGRATQLVATPGLWQVKQLRSNPQYAIGGTYSGLYLFRINEGRRLEAVRKIEGFNESSRFFEEDQKGRIWVGQFYKGLYRLDLSEDLSSATVVNVSQLHDSLPIAEQIVLSRIDNELYLATRLGIYQIDQQTDQIRRAAIFDKDIGEQQVYLLAQDQQKNIHVFAENLVGFFKQISSNNYAFVRSSLFQLRYFFNNDLLNVSVNTDSGILFNANEGFIHYDPEMENRVRVQIPLLVNRVYNVATGEEFFSRRPFEEKPAQSAQLSIQPGTKILQFRVESFQFKDRYNPQFRYFLKGFDEDFSKWTNVNTKEYTNLIEGSYEFVVQTRNYFGEIESGQVISLQVETPLYRSLLAKIVYILFALLSLWLVSRLQQSRYRRKAQRIEESKQLELDEKQQKLVEMEQQKEQELLQLEEDRTKSEFRHINNLLAASTMNLVVKNEFIETIKEELKQVNKRKDNNMETRRTLERIVREIDTNLRLQEDWEKFEHHFDQVHGNFLNRLQEQFSELTPNEQKLCVFLRLNLNTKEIANLMSISPRGVEVARYRLRKKLDLNKGQNLSKFILEY
ncbi:MAG: hypothetical protein AAFV95_10875 [Bacteroidota bacterium]